MAVIGAVYYLGLLIYATYHKFFGKDKDKPFTKPAPLRFFK